MKRMEKQNIIPERFSTTLKNYIDEVERYNITINELCTELVDVENSFIEQGIEDPVMFKEEKTETKSVELETSETEKNSE